MNRPRHWSSTSVAASRFLPELHRNPTISRSPCWRGIQRERGAQLIHPAGSQVWIKSFQLDNSPFIVGLVGHAELEPAQIPPLVEAAVTCLLEIKQRLPDTDVRLMLDVRNDASMAIVLGGLGL